MPKSRRTVRARRWPRPRHRPERGVAAAPATAAAAPTSPRPRRPAAVAAARPSLGRRRRTTRSRRAPTSASPTAARPAEFDIRNRVLATDQEHLGRPARPPAPAAARQRQDPDGHVVVQRHDHGQGAGRRPQPRRQRADRGGPRPQQGQPGVAPPGSGSSAARLLPLRAGPPGDRRDQSFARQCRGSCRGRGGTPHSKYFLFDNVGNAHLRNIVVQTSMNLTTFGLRASGTRPR